MLDVETYLLTKDNLGGPIVQMKHLPLDEPRDETISVGEVIGRILALAVVIALGVYSYFTI